MSHSLTVGPNFATLLDNGRKLELIFEKTPIKMNGGTLAATLTLDDKVLCHLPSVAEDRDPLGTFKLAYLMMVCNVIGFDSSLAFDPLRDLEMAIRRFDERFRADTWEEDVWENTSRVFYKLPFAFSGEMDESIEWQGRSYRARQEISLPYSQLYCVKLILIEHNPAIKPGAIEETLEARFWFVKEDRVPSLQTLLNMYEKSRGLN